MRITNNMVISRVLNNINVAFSRMTDLQAKASSGKEILKPADDPYGAAKAVHLRSTVASIEQYGKNVEDGNTWLSAADSALDQVNELLQRARDLALRGASDAISSAERRVIATEVDRLINGMVQAANTSVRGRYVFGGTKTLTPPVVSTGDPVTAVNYAGDSGRLAIEVNPGIVIPVGIPGDDVFFLGDNIFQTVINFRDHLMANDAGAISAGDVTSLTQAIDKVLSFRSTMGAETERLDLFRNRLEKDKVTFTSLLSKTEDVDIPRVILELRQQENVYNAALAAAARIAPHTLVDFLR